ncbi:outer membrane lipoprotein carrier protein LolA [Pedobacter sp.]|jgi:chaperone LolA|uniref:LolA family protein n=1 Tax=Pedobacter sp. TaxID=1411316 RepID=UPI002C563FA6|nr:outer membrane lipoprotein carrier protein LolA [Pedobacter sp.]HWW40445.1 outer membrane lipoprotein carrier protein LolA [Pedobacter sp.]
MRKITVLLFMLIAGIYIPGQAQPEAKAKSILAEVSKKYRSYDVVKAEFVFTIDNPEAKVKESQKGTLYVKANANKYKMSMDDKDLISDGKSQWSYLKADKEVQVSNVDNGSDALNPARIFTMYEKGFKSIYTGESKSAGKVYQMVDLAPNDIKKPYFKVRLSIDKIAKQISGVVIFDKNGNKYTYNVKSFVPNVKVPESTFIFDAKKYPGVELVDLR